MKFKTTLKAALAKADQVALIERSGLVDLEHEIEHQFHECGGSPVVMLADRNDEQYEFDVNQEIEVDAEGEAAVVVALDGTEFGLIFTLTRPLREEDVAQEVKA